MVVLRTLGWVAGLAIPIASMGAAVNAAYVAACCNANSQVSFVSTANNTAMASFSAGPGSYAVALPNARTAWVTNARNNTVSIVSLENRRDPQDAAA
jgi:DNA-binding beta-propeller fold protein YncE